MASIFKSTKNTRVLPTGTLRYIRSDAPVALTEEEIQWIKNILSDEEYKLHRNPISKWNWGKIKTAFAKEFFPEIAPVSKESSISTEERINNLLNM